MGVGGGNREVRNMIRNWLEKVYRRTSAAVLASLFLSVMAPSVILFYTGTYNVWYHAIFVVVAVGCFTGLLLHHMGYRVAAARAAQAAQAEKAAEPAPMVPRDPVIRHLDYEFGAGVTHLPLPRDLAAGKSG